MPTFPEHLSWSLCLMRFVQSLVFCVVFCPPMLVAHSIVCPSNYGFWLHPLVPLNFSQLYCRLLFKNISRFVYWHDKSEFLSLYPHFFSCDTLCHFVMNDLIYMCVMWTSWYNITTLYRNILNMCILIFSVY